MLERARRHPLGVGLVILAAALVLGVVAVGIAAMTLSGVATAPSAPPSPSPSATSERSSPSQSPDSTPEPTASLAPTATSDPVALEDQPFAVVARVDELRIRAEPGTAAHATGMLNAKDVGLITADATKADGTTWFNIWAGDDRHGWVAMGPVDDPYLELRHRVAEQIPARIVGVAAGDPGFVAWGVDAHRSDHPGPPLLVVSDDGATWRLGSMPEEVTEHTPLSIGWGPAGWLMATATETNEGAGSFWKSGDGEAWSRLPGIGLDRVVPIRVIGTDLGYMLEARDDRSGTSGAALFFSRDGDGWQQVEADAGRWLGAARTASGLLAWGESNDAIAVISSSDGVTWRPFGAGDLPVSHNFEPQLVGVADIVIGLSMDFEAQEQRLWRTRATSPTSWESVGSVMELLPGVALHDLVSDGTTVVAVGHEVSGSRHGLWRTTDGLSWRAGAVEGLDGGGLDAVAGGAGRFVAIGSSGAMATYDPVVWSSIDAASWTPSADLPVNGVERRAMGACPSLPDTDVDWLAVPPSVAVECFGNEPMTFRSWHTAAGGCGGFFPGTFEPPWLASPFASGSIILTPFPSEYGGCGSAAAAPALSEIPDRQQWIRLTGHYDDPEAATCRYTSDRGAPGVALSADEMVWRCRTVFVATAADSAE